MTEQMKKLMLMALPVAISLTSCVSSKKFKGLEGEFNAMKDRAEKCDFDLARAQRELDACQRDLKKNNDELTYLRSQNDRLVDNLGKMATLSHKEAVNLEKSLESIKEKEMRITSLQQAMNRKDSITFALVSSLKGAIGNMADEDIQISVDKGVVFVNLSDKFLFRSGSYEINAKANEVLGKVAKIVEAKPDFEVLVEGHTDNVPYANGLLVDNWDLSVKRATALVRTLQKEYNIAPSRMTAAGRGEYVPVDDNSNPAGRAANRRTRILIMPKLDQFFGMIEAELKK